MLFVIVKTLAQRTVTVEAGAVGVAEMVHGVEFAVVASLTLGLIVATAVEKLMPEKGGGGDGFCYIIRS